MTVVVMSWVARTLAVLNLAYVLWAIWRAWHRRRLDLDWLWILGTSVFGVAIQWTTGLALRCSWTSWLLCVSLLAVSLIRQRIALRRLRLLQAFLEAERDATIDTIRREEAGKQ